MKFTVSQSALARALSVVSKGVAGNTTIPILSGVCIHADNGTLEFQTTNLTISVRHRIAANVEEPGDVVISGRILSSIVKELPDSAISFDGGERTVSISCGSTSFRLNTLPAADFPEFPTYSLSNQVELPSELLSSMVDKVYRVTSKDLARPTLSGILLTVEQNVIRLVAIDSFRMAMCDSNTETSGLESQFKAIVPGNVFHDVLSLPSITEKILIGTTDSQVVFSFGNTTYVSRKIEGKFPDYRTFMPSACVTSMTVDIATLNSALKRVAVVAANNTSVRLGIDPESATLDLSASSPDQGEARETVDVDATGNPMAIGFSFRFLFDCINAASGMETFTLELQSPTQPGVFKSYGKINYLYLLMPVRM